MIKIIIVDDEKMIREGLVTTMPWKEMGIEVVGSADNGKTALEIAIDKKPHIILTDIRMPKMDGIEFLKRIKEELPKVKVVILSGYDDFSYARQALKYGATDYLIKPVNVEELQKVMEDLKNTFKEESDKDLYWLRLQREMEYEIQQYIMSIRIGNRDDAFEILSKIRYKQILNNVSLEIYKKLYIEIMDKTLHALKEDGIQLKDEQRYKYMDLINFTTLDELQEWIYSFTDKLMELVEKSKTDNYRIVVKNAMLYIDKHFNEELSIQQIAEVVHLSPNYFSHVFKKAREESFTDYLNKVRVKKAQALLAENIYKVYEVSDMVGYSDYKYFSSVFKKISGVSPKEYGELKK
ncbi:MAG: response regulator [Clostridiaceae bacterium]|nr:response regulator [Clostridiaceae bacterium]